MKKLYNFLREKGFYLALGVGIVAFATLIYMYDYDEAGGDITKEKVVDLNKALSTEDIADASDANKEEKKDTDNNKVEDANRKSSDEADKEKNQDGEYGEEIQNIASADEVKQGDNASDEAKAENKNEVSDDKKSYDNNEVAVNDDKVVETGSDSAIAASIEELKYQGDKELLWPLEGNVIIPFSMETTTYFKTLDAYKCNPGIVIEAEEGSAVFSAYEGVVEKIEDTNEYGTCVTVNLGNGYKAIYGQLMNITVKEGDELGKASIIGKVAPTSDYFKKEGNNLFFEITKDDKPVNPVNLID